MFNHLFLLSLLFLTCMGCKKESDNLPDPKVDSVRKIWDISEHNAFTDLICYQELFFCTFRESDTHAGGKEGTIRLLMSKDGLSWSSATSISKEGVDLRDPSLSQMPDGRMMLNVQGAFYNAEGKILKRSPFAAFSANGVDWSPLIDLGINNEWIWGVTWHDGIGYGMSYHPTDYDNSSKPWKLQLLKTIDGLKYEVVKRFEIPSNPSEATLRFKEDGTLVTLLRRNGNAWIGHSTPPYTLWDWYETTYKIGGPDFVIAPNGKMWAAARKVTGTGENIETSTIVAYMTLDTFDEVLKLPSGGDTGYPGMVYQKGKLYISYYSSHEGSSKIYFAQISFP